MEVASCGKATPAAITYGFRATSSSQQHLCWFTQLTWMSRHRCLLVHFYGREDQTIFSTHSPVILLRSLFRSNPHCTATWLCRQDISESPAISKRVKLYPFPPREIPFHKDDTGEMKNTLYRTGSSRIEGECGKLHDPGERRHLLTDQQSSQIYAHSHAFEPVSLFDVYSSTVVSWSWSNIM
jgi:hypothetical protein